MIKIPDKCNFIFDKLENSGFEVYAVGGCVRDSLMGKEPQDWDFTTNATPNEICKVFENYKFYDVGRKYGTISIVNDKETYEITTFRGDGSYSDARHPDSVFFCSNVEEDLSRRDFTVNSIAFSRKRGIVDPFGGVKDIQKKIIRCTGEPVSRFSEDALRIMRAIRFSSVLAFSVDNTTKEAIFKHKDSLTFVHPNRMNKEFVKLLTGQNVTEVLSEYAEVLAVIIPEIKPMFDCTQNNPHHKYSVWNHTIKTFEYAPKDEVIRLALFFHDIGKPYVKTTDKKGIDHFKTHQIKSTEIAECVMRRFGFSVSLIRDVTLLVKFHDERFRNKSVSVKSVLKETGTDLFYKLLIIAKCDMFAQSNFKREEKILLLKEVEAIFEMVTSENQCYSLAQLEVNGNDIMNLGYTGEEIGHILNALLKAVIEDKIQNKKEVLLNAVVEGNVICPD